ncbi:hypothetical protein ABBQ38_003221 [Trebouxia sp. C0009 RCD-2024]
MPHCPHPRLSESVPLQHQVWHTTREVGIPHIRRRIPTAKGSRLSRASMASNRGGLGDSWTLDADKPWYYQHIEGSSQWDWRMTWGHASSPDLVHWKHEPIAINPTEGGYDASGCWSGTTVLDTDGTPTMIYTGVRRRDNKDCGPLPHAAVDLGLDMIECQMVATCQEGDMDLIRWHKQEQPIIPHPPDNMKLTGFRDPYIIQAGGPHQKWKMLLGSGIEGQGGTLLMYEATHLTSGWQYKGSFINGQSKPFGKHDLGAMWECPFLTPLQEPSALLGSSAAPGSNGGPQTLREDQQYMMCVSPYPHHLKDRLTNPCLYWLGYIQQELFQIAESDGPHLLDLGDVLYAPNCFQDAQGRSIMLAWLQELRQGGAFDYAGCISLPRVLSYKNGRLHQQAAPELRALQQEPSWRASEVQVSSRQSVAVQHVRGPSWFAEFTLQRGDAAASGLLLRSWLYQGPEKSQACAAALLVDWGASQLQVVFPTELDEQNMTFDASSDMKRIGGPIVLGAAQQQQVTVQVYVDHSAVEVFLSSGEALATRVYRGAVTPDEDPGMFFISHQGSTTVSNVHMSAMGSIWTQVNDQPAKAFEPAERQ